MAEVLFDAFVSGDDKIVLEFCLPGTDVVQNHAAPMSLDQLLAFSVSVRRIVPDYQYADVVRTATATGFIEEHSVRGTLPGGAKLRLAPVLLAQCVRGKSQTCASM